MSTIAATATLASLVAEQPGRVMLLERLHLDYCCGGRRTLAEACTDRGLDLDTVVAALETIDAAGNTHGRRDTVDWREASIEDLCAHIIAEHHDYLRKTLPRLHELLATVIRVHGAAHPELAGLAETFKELRSELEPHLASEEDRLFPACIAAERGDNAVDEELLREHEHDHARVAAALDRLREQTEGYADDRALCATHQALLRALAELERDTHQHVHKENNILFTRVREPASVE
jgi:regulator of cell morphogenesis and NO signaling